MILQVTYPWWLGRLLHTLPLALILGSMLLQQGRSTIAKAQEPNSGVSAWSVLVGAGVAATALLSAILCGALLGLLRTVLSGATVNNLDLQADAVRARSSGHARRHPNRI